MSEQYATEVSGRPRKADRPVLTWQRSLTVLIVLTVIVALVRWALMQVSEVRRQQAMTESPDSWAGFVVALEMLVLIHLATLVILFVGMTIGFRGRRGGGRFVAVFAAMLVILVLVSIARFGFGAIGLPFIFSGPEIGFFVCVVLPSFWTVPALVTSLIPIRAAGIIIGSCVVVALVSWGASVAAATIEQAAYSEEYRGPVFVPVGNPDDMVDGYDLENVELPNESSDESAPTLHLEFLHESGTGGLLIGVYEGDYQ